MQKASVSVVIALLIGIFLDSVFFNTVNIVGIRPDALLAIIVSIGFMLGGWRTALIGCITGLTVDVMFYKIVGINAALYMLSGMLAGVFHRKFYADNIIVPAIVAAILSFCKETFYALFTLIRGAEFSLPLIFITYILPCAVLTGLFCLLVHLAMRPLLKKYSKKVAERDLERNRLL
ncbi:MAG: rod shape-determining protein MreD [Clostridia bacterium]